MINYIILYGICWFFTTFRPLQDKIDQYFLSKADLNWFEDILYEFITCQTCLTFWTSLIFFPLYITLILAIIAQLHQLIREYLTK